MRYQLTAVFPRACADELKKHAKPPHVQTYNWQGELSRQTLAAKSYSAYATANRNLEMHEQ